MCRIDERTHKHHIIPRYMDGPDSSENLVEVTVTQHVMFHFCNYQLWGNEEDRLAWRGLSGQITLDEAALEAQSLGRKKGGNKCKENKIGFFGLSPDERSEANKKGGNKHKENKTGVCGRSPEKMSEDGKKGGTIAGRITYEKRIGVHGRSPEKMSQDGKKGGKIAGNKNKENKTGFCGRSPEKMSEDGRKAGKASASQKWQCTETGYSSTAGGLTRYQKAKGIDTSNRIKVDGPRIWEITFENGRVIIITIPLKTWAEENSYSCDCLRKVKDGKIKNYKGIIKIVCS